MINILIVEDEQDFILEITTIINSMDRNNHIDIAKNKVDALAFIESSFYDLILLDLRIPNVDGGETDPAHGQQVLSEARVSASGTPLIVLTGSSAEEFLPNIISLSDKHDVWGDGHPIQMIAFHRKHKLDSFPQLLKPYLQSLQKVQDIELIKQIELTKNEDRLIRIFCRRRSGTKCEVYKINGGFSATKVYRLVVTNSQGVVLHHIICKIGDIRSVRIESDNYEAHVVRLQQHATPRKVAVLEHGAKNISGIFYSLAEGYEKNVFEYLLSNPENPKKLINSIESLLKPWLGIIETRKSIKEIRQRVLWDEDFQAIRHELPIEWIEDFEEQFIQTRWFCEHGDLHGMNILLSKLDDPILIDYGDVGDGVASLDPITLELSLFFHPEGSLFKSDWPSAEQAKDWGYLEKYLDGCPYPEFIKECRNWAIRSAAGRREVGAIAYAYVLRQWKYNSTNKQRVLDLLAGIKIFYDNT